MWLSALQGAERHAKSLAVTADAGYRDCSCRSAERHAQSLAYQMQSVRQPTTLRPNQSVKRTRSGMPPGPGWRYAVHFRHPGPGVIPLRSAYLQR
jgi:hypothetical protein